MKLRNKKTGEIVEFLSLDLMDDGEIEFTYTKANGYENAWSYRTLKKFNDEWEDYKPKEPIIKDEKIRKAVRAWADANNFINEIEVSDLNAGTRFSEGHWSIEFIGYFIYDLKIGSTYTIADLCGEEK